MRRRKKERIIWWVFFVMGLVFIIPQVYNTTLNLLKLSKLNAKKKVLENERKRLEAEIKQAETKEYIERVARIKLGLKKPNEIEYRFISTQDK